MSFKLITLNTELRKHLDRWVPFIKDKRPDIICLQETFEDIVQDLAKDLGYESIFQPRVSITGEPEPEGIAILSRFPISGHQLLVYEQQEAVISHLKGIHESPVTSGVLLATMQIEGKEVTVGTTHFTWSAMGQVTEYQQKAFERLLSIIQPLNELILCGDFNTPRGDVLFDSLAERLNDNIPAEIKTTVDPDLHRVKDLELVVDGVFTTPNYRVLEVHVRKGLSDHQAVEVTISI